MRIIGNDPSIPRKTQVVASGTLSTGDTVVVNSDGTVSAVSATGGGAAAGTPAVFEESNTKPPAATYDATNGKVVIAYTQASGSYLGYAVVGTVSGNSITFGTPVLFKSTGSFLVKEPAITYDSNAGKVVVAYYDEGSTGYGLAKVGTVSGTSISFGSAATFESANVSHIGATFDSTNNKVVISYIDSGNSSYGTAVVGTVSGTSISFGTPVVFESAAAPYTSPVFDTNNDKVVISYRDNGNSLYGTSVVGTVSGTSISFGTPVVFESANSTYVSSVFDSGSGKVITSYVDEGNLSYGTAVVGTVSGTSISFGTPVVFSASDTTYTSLSYDTANDLVSVSYRDSGNSSYGTVAFGTVSGTSISFETPLVFNEAYSATGGSTYDVSAGRIVTTFFDNSLGNWGSAVVISSSSTNLTAENYIGIARSGAADGDGVVVNTQGTVANIPVTYYDIANASYEAKSFDVTGQTGGNPVGIRFKPDGTKFYLLAENQDSVYQYSLSTAWDISTASYDSVSFSYLSQDSFMAGMTFNNDGTKMYLSSYNTELIYQYSLSTAWDLSTASYDSATGSISQQLVSTGLTFNNEGSKLFIPDRNLDAILEYSLSSNFDITSISYSTSFSVSSEDTSPKSVAFNADGTKMFVLGDGNDNVYQYSLSTAFDVSTASYDSVSFSVGDQDTDPEGMAIGNSGTKMYIVGDSSPEKIYQYSIQNALTAGQSYYVQTDGTLSTTAGDPSVFAGTAVSSTKLIVKG